VGVGGWAWEVRGGTGIRPLRVQGLWALPIDAAPIRDAAVLIGADGRIAAIGPAQSVPTPPDAETLDYGAGILLPGLVNTHTHLELTGFQQTASEQDFRRWILSIRRLKQARRAEEFLEAARRGLLECWAGGVTTIADTGDSGAVIQALDELEGSGVAYHEVFGPHPDQLEETFSDVRRRIAELSRHAGHRVQLGVSPHAPYTVSGPLYSRVAEWAHREGLPLAVHIAESRAEREFVSQGTGPFAEAWAARGIPLGQRDGGTEGQRDRTGMTPVGLLDYHGVLGPDTLCIHAIELDDSDIALLAERGAAVAHCPVSNAAHAHGTAPLAALRAAGVRVGIGTDSVASVGQLDLFREARAAQAIAKLSDEQTLALATLEGARALAREQEIGSLSRGKWGDLIAVEPAGGAARTAPIRAVLQAAPQDVRLTVLGGRMVHRRAPA
jgi:5-methylthioadenosine/S-adenosylhomocysteine deaminase